MHKTCVDLLIYISKRDKGKVRVMKTDLNEILAILEDPSNDLPIEIVNSKGESARFAQIALIPMSVDLSDENEDDDIICHYFAFMQPINENDEPMGEDLIFDLSKHDDGELSIDVVTDQYLITELYAEFRKLRRAKSDEDKGEDEDKDEDEVEIEVEDGDEDEYKADEFDDETELEKKSDENDDAKEEKAEKKSFFAKLFGKNKKGDMQK